MLKKEFIDRKPQSDDIDVNNILDLVLLSEELFIQPTAIKDAVIVVGPSRSAITAYLICKQGLKLARESASKPPSRILVDRC